MLPTQVRFRAAPGEYVLSLRMCANYDCPCTEVTILLRPAERKGEPAQSITVDVTSWRELNPPERSAEAAAIVKECLRDFPESERDALRLIFQQKQTISQHLKTFRLPDDWGRDGLMVGFDEVVAAAGQFMLDGLLEVVWRFDLAGRWYLVTDAYCVNPNCDCESAMLAFYDMTHHVVGSAQSAATSLFAIRMNLDGTWSFEDLKSCDERTARMLVMALKEKKPSLIGRLQWRYQVMHEIGRRSGRGRSHSDTPALIGAGDADAHALLTRAAEAGRNDPCPCGSGKKYKKCCGR